MNPFRAADPVVQSARSYARQLVAEMQLYGVRAPEALLTASPTWSDIFSAVGVLLAHMKEDALLPIAPFIYTRYADIAAADTGRNLELLKAAQASEGKLMSALRQDLIRVNAETARHYTLYRAIEHERSRLSTLIALVALSAISGLSLMICNKFAELSGWATFTQWLLGVFGSAAIILYLLGVVGSWSQPNPPARGKGSASAPDAGQEAPPPAAVAGALLMFLALAGVAYGQIADPPSKPATFDSGATLTVVALVGLLGSTFSVLQRLQRSTSGVEPLRALYSFRAVWSQMPLSLLSGTIAAMVIYGIFVGGMIEGTLFPKIVNHLSPADTKNALPLKIFWGSTGPATYADHGRLLVWAFIAGFAERLVPDILDRFTAAAKK